MVSGKNQVPDNLDNVVAISELAPGFAKVCINYSMNQARLYLDKGL
jgi:hypothetical protein